MPLELLKRQQHELLRILCCRNNHISQPLRLCIILYALNRLALA